MARIISQTLIRDSQTLILRPSSRLVSFRSRSHRSSKSPAQLVEIDLDAEVTGDVEVLGMRRLEDAIHGIIVRRSAPDWLPFIPGSSYWVPPSRKRALGLIDLVGKLGNPMREEEVLSLTTARGWPSMDFFVEGTLARPVKDDSTEKAEPDDEE